jgi:hypothetical protein
MKIRFFTILLLVSVILASCSTGTVVSQVNVTITHDGKTDSLAVPQNSTISQAIALAGITLGSLDRVEPDKANSVTQDLAIKIVRVQETFTVEETVLPFESQTIKNESLPTGQTILIQAGRNGLQSITYRVVTEDGVEVSRTVTKTEVTQAAQPEIIMVGVQSDFRAVEIAGVIAYISSSNAWLMESSTGNRRALVSTGDLDGRIFTLSPDRKWLLFSRGNTGQDESIINTLWVISLTDPNAEPLALTISGDPVKNVVHYAEWVPGKTQTIAYSTVEPRPTAPGWQANNDLQVLKFNDGGVSSEHKTVIATNSGGLYGFWGTVYAWSPDASEIAYARPDSIGLVDSKTGSLNPIIEFTPYNTQGDWAWVPGITWSDSHALLYFVMPASNDANNTQFDLNAAVIGQNDIINLKANIGLFAYPVASATNDSGFFQVAYLSAIIPDQSESSKYALRVMDRDGSNDKKLYPGEGVQGLEAQQIVWSPLVDGTGNLVIAFIAQGNLMFVDPSTGELNQITGDGSISRIDWK